MFRAVTRLAALLALLLAAAAHAGQPTLPPVSGTPILKVDGAIGATNAGDAAMFDLALLDSLPQHTLVTSTPWTEGRVTYQGVLARDLMRAVGARGSTASAIALNDYRVEIPLADFAAHDVLLAYRADGQLMTPRNKGPVFVVYPFDRNPALHSEEIYMRSVWQLTTLTVTD